MKKVLFLLTFFLSAPAFAGQYTFTGKITMVFASTNPSHIEYSVNNPGYLGIAVAGLPVSNCVSGGKAWVAIGEDHPLYSSALSLATAALISGNDVTIAYFDTCTVKDNSWDFSYLSVKD